MTNPNNAIGTNAAYSGRTSVNAFNDDLAAYSRGILSGWNCQVDTGLTVLLGGGNSARDVAIAEDNAGNKTTINNISLDEVPVTLDTAPGANSRIDAIVAYVDNPPQGSNSTADNPESCGIIPVAGTPAVEPQAPDDNAIRTAITADGASGTTAYYVVLATVTVPTGTTDLIPGYIKQGIQATTANINIPDGSITADKIDFTTLKGKRVTTGVLYDNGTTTAGSITFSASMDDYDYLYFLIARPSSDTGWGTKLVRVSDFRTGRWITEVTADPNNSTRVFSIYGIAFSYSNSTTVRIQRNCDVAFNTSGIAGGPSTGGSLAINKIIGIKLVDGD